MISAMKKLPILAACLWIAAVAFAQPGPKFEVSFPVSAHAGPLTGRVFVMLAKKETPEPLQQAGSWGGQTPFFAVDVEQLQPGRAGVLDGRALGYPLNSLKDVPAGDYFVQALVSVYTKFPRADGHTIWAHMDQWEGQHFNRSPGNLYSGVRQVH